MLHMFQKSLSDYKVYIGHGGLYHIISKSKQVVDLKILREKVVLALQNRQILIGKCGSNNVQS